MTNDIDINQLADVLNNKIDLPLNKSQDSIDYVVDWKFQTDSDPTWYRIYKSGWVEQGGELTNTNSIFTVDLIKQMANTKYHINITLGENDKNPNYTINVGNKTLSSFSGGMSSNNITYPSMWEVKGKGM